MNDPKPWYESKTLWVNIVSVIVVALGLVAENAGVLSLSAQAVAVIGIIIAVLNAGLRVFATSQPVSIGGAVPAKGAGEVGRDRA